MTVIGQSSSRRSIAAGSGQALERTPDSRVPGSVGREARLELVFEPRRGVTVLAHGYAEPPFRIGRTFDLAGRGVPDYRLLRPGVFAGDLLRQSIRVRRGARVVLTSQARCRSIRRSRPIRLNPRCSIAALTLNRRASCTARGIRPSFRAGAARSAVRVGWPTWSPLLERRGDGGPGERGEAWRVESLAHELGLRRRRAALPRRYTVLPRAVAPITMDCRRSRYLGRARTPCDVSVRSRNLAATMARSEPGVASRST